MSANTPVIPMVTPTRRSFGLWIPVAIGLVVLLGVAAVFRPWRKSDPAPAAGTFFTVAAGDMDIKINKDGELQAVEYTDIICKVEGATQIIRLVKEGTTVKKGDELVVLDSSSIQDRKEQTDLDLKKSESNLTIAREMRDIQMSQNSANKEAAEVALQLAKLDLQQYNEGTYPQVLENAKTARAMTEITLKNRQEDLEQTRSLNAKGFVTPADVKKAELDVTNARNEFAKATTSLKVLESYSHEMDTARLRSALAQAEQRLARTIKENASNLAQRNADVAEKEQSLAMLKKRAEKLQEQLDNCTIRAPEDGLVIYASTLDRNMRDQIQEGVQVREKQLLIRLPEVQHMKAVLRIPEAMVPKLDVNKKQRATVRIVGVNRPIGATLTRVSILADSGQRWGNPDLKEYPVDLTLDETPPGLKPSVGVQAELLVNRLEQVLAVPMDAIYGSGRESYVFIKHEGSVVPTKVTLGVSNDTSVQVVSGLTEGDEILRLQAGQGRTLLENAGIKAAPATRPEGGGGGRRGRRDKGETPPT